MLSLLNIYNVNNGYNVYLVTTTDIKIFLRRNIIMSISTLIIISVKLKNFYCYLFVLSFNDNLSLNVKSVAEAFRFLKAVDN